ncbi:MAG: (d)CMP kinase [Chloroflexota bacterium]
MSTIAIDGPAASGKTTLAQNLAEDLNYMFFDTGVMYRAVTFAILKKGVSINDESICASVAESTRIDVQTASEDDGRVNDILIDGEDATWAIRQPDVDANVSIVAAYPGVRQALTKQQRRIGLQGNVVMVGRDIGTVVMPDANLKIYLDATVKERARRRYDECIQRGEEVSYLSVLKSMRIRDEIDSNREVAPLRPAQDAHMISSDGKDIQEVFEIVKNLVTMELGV